MFSKDIARTVYNVFNFQCSTVFSTDPANAVKLTLDFEKKKMTESEGYTMFSFCKSATNSKNHVFRL